MTTGHPSFQAFIASSSQRLEEGLTYYLENLSYPSSTLQEAMAYSVLSGGKRIRPLLIYATGQIFEAPLENLDLAAIAVELIHSYSLVHDDLPAMDDADLRRGRPSCFKAFGEDLAILAGDGLQTLAFEVLSEYPAPLSAKNRLAMVQTLSRAAGPAGMVGGQALDILNNNAGYLSEREVLKLYELKTGALLRASITMGMLASSGKKKKEVEALENYAHGISLAFQIQDDILDIEGNAEELGKPTGIDKHLEKKTYPEVLGLAQAKLKVASLYEQAFEALEIFEEKADYLRRLTEWVGHRKT